MKKFKHIVPFLLALLMAFAIPVAACGGNDEEEVEETSTLQSIEINTDNVKVSYGIGETFTSEGLTVVATLKKDGDDTAEEKVLNADEYVIDSSAFDSTKMGTYQIGVSYTYNEVTKSASYNVMVSNSDGLKVALTEGTEDTYTLDADHTSVEIDTNKIVVNEINVDGSVGKVITDYTVKLFKGSEAIDLTSGKATVAAGAYTIYVEKLSERNDGFMRKAFVIVYVNDDLVDFKLDSGNFEQSSGVDEISETWSFTATYASGVTKTVTAKECEYELNTMNVVKDGPLQISYTGVNAKGGEVTKTLDLTYTINRVYGKVEYTFDHSAIELAEDNVDLKQIHLTGVNAFLQVAGGSLKYRSKTANSKAADAIEVKENGFKVTFEGIGKITVGFGSTSSSNESVVGLIDAGGNYIAATYDSENVTPHSVANIYVVKGTVESVLTFTITKPGVYTIAAPVKAVGGKPYDRACRVYSIAMEDNVDDPANIVCDVDFTDKAKFATGDIAKSTASAPVAVKDLSGNETGISVTKSPTPTNANKIATVDGVNVLQLQGTANKERNSVLFNVGEGSIKITVRYFGDAGKYIDIFDANGTVVASSSSMPTTGNKNEELIEYSCTLDIDAAKALYLGSHSGSINIAYIKVEKA